MKKEWGVGHGHGSGLITHYKSDSSTRQVVFGLDLFFFWLPITLSVQFSLNQLIGWHGTKTNQDTEPVVQQSLVGRIPKGVRSPQGEKLTAGFVFANSKNELSQPTKAI